MATDIGKLIELSAKMLVNNEGKSNKPYNDNGSVSIGIGTRILDREGNATPEGELALKGTMSMAEYDNLVKEAKAWQKGGFKGEPSFELKPGTAEKASQNYLKAEVPRLKKFMRANGVDFESMPVEVQLSLIDGHYNRGHSNFAREARTNLLPMLKQKGSAVTLEEVSDELLGENFAIPPTRNYSDTYSTENVTEIVGVEPIQGLNVNITDEIVTDEKEMGTPDYDYSQETTQDRTADNRTKPDIKYKEKYAGDDNQGDLYAGDHLSNAPKGMMKPYTDAWYAYNDVTREVTEGIKEGITNERGLRIKAPRRYYNEEDGTNIIPQDSPIEQSTASFVPQVNLPVAQATEDYAVEARTNPLAPEEQPQTIEELKQATPIELNLSGIAPTSTGDEDFELDVDTGPDKAPQNYITPPNTSYDETELNTQLDQEIDASVSDTPDTAPADFKAESKLSTGDTIGTVGMMGADVLKHLNTLSNTIGTSKSESFFEKYGDRSLNKLTDAQYQLDRLYEEEKKDILMKERTARKSNRLNARGINTLRALDFGTLVGSGKAINEAMKKNIGGQMQIMKEQSSLMEKQDMVKMGKRQEAFDANEAKRDAGFTARASDIAGTSEMFQNLGKNMNQLKTNEVSLNAINQLSKYGLKMDADGNIIKA